MAGRNGFKLVFLGILMRSPRGGKNRGKTRKKVRVVSLNPTFGFMVSNISSWFSWESFIFCVNREVEAAQI